MSKKGPPTLLDVARRAGVHKNTVSVALNSRRAATVISDETRRRIMAAVAELDYQPNAVARSLRRRQTNSIGFYRYVEHGPLFAQDPFNAAVITGLTTACHRLRRDLLIHSSFWRSQVADVYSELTNGKVDGLVVLAMHNDALSERLAASHVPTVAIVDAVPGLSSVTVDDAEGSRLLAAHLAEKGHRRVLYRGEPHGFTSTQRRLRAFLDAAAEYGMEVTVVHPSNLEFDLEKHEADLLTRSGKSRATAVACWTDASAFGVLSYCRKRGIRVPDDLAVVGFDGVPTTLELAYRLTTVQAPWKQVAETAVQLVVDKLEGKEVPPEVTLPVSLVVGDTT